MTHPHVRHLLFASVAVASSCVSPEDRDGDDGASSETSAAVIASAAAAVTDDAYVASGFPADTHGTQSFLVLGTGPSNLHHVYLKLAVSGIPSGATDVTATLQISPQTSASHVINAHCGSSNAWSAAAITWNNQVGFAAPIVASINAETAGAPASFDVSSCVTGNGTFIIVLDEPTGTVVKFDSTRSVGHRPAVAVTYTPPSSCTGPDANLVPCPGKRWEGANPAATAVDVANLQSFEAMQGVQLGVVHLFRTPGSPLWGNPGTFQEQVYLNTAAPRTNPRYLYIGYRPNADWSLFDGVGGDDGATINRIHADARRTIALFAQARRKVWINAVNHEPERYVFGCGGGNATNAHNTVASYQAAWRNVVAIFDAEIAAAGLPTRHADPQYPVVWAINAQNLVKATNPATCQDAQGNGLSTFRAVMLALAPRTTSGSLIIQWFGWNPYTPAGGRPLTTVIDDGYNFLIANAPADLRALPWHFGEFGYLGDSGAPTVAQANADFTSLATRLDANSFPNVRMLLYFDAVGLQDPATVGFGAAFRSYAMSSTIFH